MPERYNARGAFCFLAQHRDIDGTFDVSFTVEFELFNSSRANLIFQFSDFCGNYSGARLRDGQVLVCDSRSFAEVTYKPATTAATHAENNVIIKPETNLPIQPEDAATAKQLLANLGIMQLVEVNKYRRSFQSSDFPQATVAIDEIKDAGTFVEVEVLSDDKASALMTISEIETKLGLNSMEIVTRPYRDICMGY